MGFFDIPNGGGWFGKKKPTDRFASLRAELERTPDARTRAEEAYLEKTKKRMGLPKPSRKARRYIRESAARGRRIETAQREIDYLKDREREAKVRAELKRRKKAMKKPTSLDYLGEFIGGIKVKKKKQGRPLSRKRRIGLI